MARPYKPIALSTGKISKEDKEKRKKIEESLRGKSDKLLKPPRNLTKGAKKYFKEIVNNLEESEILGNGDIGIVTITAMTRDKIDYLETLIKTSSDIEDIKSLIKLQSTLNKDLKGFYNDLGLSPTSRSRLASLQGEKMEQEEDPFLQALKQLKESNSYQ